MTGWLKQGQDADQTGHGAQPWLALGAILGALAVAAGAFGAHALKDVLTPEMLAIFDTAARYQLIHALALCLVGTLGRRRWLTPAAWCLALGIALFSGSLYVLALTGSRALVLITPLGGLALIVGWGFLALSALSGQKDRGSNGGA